MARLYSRGIYDCNKKAVDFLGDAGRIVPGFHATCYDIGRHKTRNKKNVE
jgi:hypothetical protein